MISSENPCNLFVGRVRIIQEMKNHAMITNCLHEKHGDNCLNMFQPKRIRIILRMF